MARPVKKSLGELLHAQGVITPIQWEEAQEEAKKTNASMHRVILKLGILSEEDLVNFISQQMQISLIELENYLIDPKLIELVPEKLARKHLLIPILKIGNSLTCAMADVFDIYAMDEVALKTGFTIEPAIATEAQIKKVLDEQYAVLGNMQDIIQSMSAHDASAKLKDPHQAVGDEAPVIKLVNLMIAQAIRDGVSDIHIEPEETEIRIRFRIDGILREKESPPKHFQSAIISRIKILAEMNISERRRPQDGRFQMKMENRHIDIRVSIVPTVYGENVVLRLLDATNISLGLDQMGFGPEMLSIYKQALLKPNGIILVTGPTGSGKTTTLYASLNTINTPEKKIITIEDPVEYRLSGVRQIQVDVHVELTFANGLRSILRQDPNVIMIGEIRDKETADIAIQAALTGHLVIATLHTNNAAGAMSRLIDLGVEPFLLSSAIIGILAQRLLRALCKDCAGKGCSSCTQSGYKGRTGIYEFLVPNEEIHRLTIQKADMEEIQQAAIKAGMKTMREDGMLKVEQGITSKAEVLRVTQEI